MFTTEKGTLYHSVCSTKHRNRIPMDINIAEVINIVKTTKNNIDREDRLKKYFEALACEMVSKALEEIDRELAAQYGKDGWQVERRDCRTLQTTYGTICIKRRRMRKKEGACFF